MSNIFGSQAVTVPVAQIMKRPYFMYPPPMFADVLDFMMHLQPTQINVTPCVPDEKTKALRIRLITEEIVKELLPALENDDLLEIADGCIDGIYVLLGTLISYGMDGNALWRLVHEGNMDKVRNSRIDEHGKVIKPVDWKHPDVSRVLKDQWDRGY